MRRHSDLHQSAAISAVLLVLLFALPLAVVVPFQTELFSDDPIAVESEREPFQPGDLDGEMVLKVLAGDTVEEMTEAQIYDIADKFGQAAATAKACGFDMVMIHMGHGWLLHQFLSMG